MNYYLNVKLGDRVIREFKSRKNREGTVVAITGERSVLVVWDNTKTKVQEFTKFLKVVGTVGDPKQNISKYIVTHAYTFNTLPLFFDTEELAEEYAKNQLLYYSIPLFVSKVSSFISFPEIKIEKQP